jgi:UDP-MurNAc hydroxylase
MSWEDLFLTLRFIAFRTPDRYNQHLFTLLKMADHSALREIATQEIALAARQPEDTFTLSSNGTQYEVQRFCPHAGADLRTGKVVDGCLVCPNHGWRFRLETGECIETQGYQIYCKQVRDTP